MSESPGHLRPRKRRKSLRSEKLFIDWFVAQGSDSSEVDTVDFIITIIIVVSAVVDQNKYQIVCESSEIEALNVDMNTFDDNRWKLLQALDNNRQRGFDQNSKIPII